MKASKFLFAMLISGLTLTMVSAFGQESTSLYYYPFYPVKSAIIEYTLTGSINGTETWYMDSNGKLTARYTETTEKSFGSVTKRSQVMIQKDTVIYTIDLVNKTGFKRTVHPDQKSLDKWAKSPEQTWTDLGYRKTGEEVILDKKCDVWEGGSVTVSIWQSLALKTVYDLFGKYTSEAKKVEVNVPVEKSKFDIPSDIKMEDAIVNTADPVFDSIGKDLKKGLNDLKDMFGPKKKK